MQSQKILFNTVSYSNNVIVINFLSIDTQLILIACEQNWLFPPSIRK